MAGSSARWARCRCRRRSRGARAAPVVPRRSNHRSWVDILVLQSIFNRRIPFLKFFLKRQLIWVPLLGLAWWALDFPFMRRYSSSSSRAIRTCAARISRQRGGLRAFQQHADLGDELRRGHAIHRGEARRSVRRTASCCRRAPAASRSCCPRWAASCTRCSTSPSRTAPARRACGTCAAGISVASSSTSARAPSRTGWRGRFSSDPVFRERFQAWLVGIWAEKDHLLAEIGSEP